jgi:NAD(P)-dependent dehydrogenase (short-subunit alcohol dehydrogenase family)
VALITGGTRGVGRGIAEAFLKEGANVAILGRDSEAGASTVASLQGMGSEPIFVQGDISVPNSIAAAIESVVNHFGELHVLVNNAAATRVAHTHGGRLADISVEHWEDYIGVNITGPFLCTKYSLPHLLAAGGGVILNINSMGPDRPTPEGGGYGVTKSGVTALTRYTAVDYAPTVRCNEIILGIVAHDSPLHRIFEDPEVMDSLRAAIPLQRLGRPEEIGRAAIFLCSDDSSYITGTSLRIDGGITLSTPLPSQEKQRAVLADQGGEEGGHLAAANRA